MTKKLNECTNFKVLLQLKGDGNVSDTKICTNHFVN